MAVQSRFLQTPTGRPYDPSRDIERSFDKTANIVTGAIETNQKYKADQEAAFGQMYSNLGELESNLQENYAGIGQQMVDSTREFMKEHYRKGGRSTDPEFQSTLGQMTGRIRAGAANADRNREMLKQSAELIKADPAIIDKASALSGLYQKMQDPDFLISQNQFNPEDYLSQYINPNKVWEGVAKALPTTEEWNNQYTDASGNLRSKTILMNPLINKDAPLDANGRPNLNITPDFTKEVMSGTYGQRVIDQVLRTANEKYSNLPNDIAMQMAIKDGLSGAMGMNLSDKVVKSARDIEKEDREYNLRVNKYNLDIAELAAKNKTATAQAKDIEDANALFGEMQQSYTSGSPAFLGKFEGVNPNIKSLKWAKEKDIDEKYNVLNSLGEWQSVEPETRIALLNELGVEIPKSKIWKVTESDSENAYKDAVAAFNKLESPIAGLKFLEKEGVGKEATFVPQVMRIESGDDLERSFYFLNNILKGKKMSPTSVDPIEQPQGGASRFNPPN